MSNTLYITVGQFHRLDSTDNDYNVVVIAADSYGQDVMTFDDEQHLCDCYPTKEDLVVGVLQLPAFEGSAVIKDDGTYELDAVGSVIIQGYPE